VRSKGRGTSIAVPVAEVELLLTRSVTRDWIFVTTERCSVVDDEDNAFAIPPSRIARRQRSTRGKSSVGGRAEISAFVISDHSRICLVVGAAVLVLFRLELYAARDLEVDVDAGRWVFRNGAKDVLRVFFIAKTSLVGLGRASIKEMSLFTGASSDAGTWVNNMGWSDIACIAGNVRDSWGWTG
jgi:hypothetical protein